MRIAPILAAAGAATLLTLGNTVAATAATPTHDSGGVIWVTVVSGPDLHVRDQPNTSASIVAELPYGSQDRVECATWGSTVNGNPSWYWLVGVRGWVSAAYVDTGGRHVPSCSGTSDPCPQWRDGDCHHDPCTRNH
ncbi:SH3 domain-containing protein [Streptomyces luteocolor]|uniref:SH3 domain-containing protein n=1 Tax=Streptomyces luteocolor TaxID=285500 RepID=UPI000852B561|nr:SH3 domain-containing protein [Streptomyces luteocolor]